MIFLLYFIGLGLFSEDDISFKGFNALKNVDCIYAEFYTAKLMGGNIDNLISMFFGILLSYLRFLVLF